MTRYLIIILTFLLQASNIFAQTPNFRLHPGVSNQIEPSIVRHPTNPQILFCSAYTIYLSFRSESVYLSTNGGLTWSGTDTNTGANMLNGHGGDPGPVIDKNGTFILTHQGGVVAGMYANYSSNNGSTWSSNVPIATNDQDKGAPGTDGIPASPYFGRTYLAWTRYTSPFPIVFSYTTNSGVSWSAYSQVNNYSGRQSQGPFVSVGPGGLVFLCWASSDLSSPFTERAIGFAVSSNGGVNWSVQETAFNITGIKSSSLPPWGIRVNSYPTMDVDKTGGSRNGWIYIVTTEKNQAPAGSDPDIVFFRSTNNGSTWTAGTRVNQDAMNNGRVQYFPAITVDDNGGINVLYYDNRNVSDSMDAYISRSTDGGNTWTDYRTSDHRFYPSSVSGLGGGNQGDNIGIVSSNNKLIPVWMDNSTGKYQVWSAIIDLSVFGIKTISNEVPSGYSLSQNYPNPFNPKTVISFQLAVNSFATLKVYDLLGREVSVLVNENLKPGTYEIDWNASNYPSGVYYYKMIVHQGGSSTGDYSETKKMVLVK